MRDGRLDSLRARVLIGLGLALQGCDADPAHSPRADDPALSRPERPPASVAPDALPTGPRAPDYHLRLSHLGTPARGHLQSFLVQGAPPGADLYLVQGNGNGQSTISGVDVDVVDGHTVGVLPADPAGDAEFRGLVRETEGYDLQTFQVLAQDADGQWHRSKVYDEHLQFVTATIPMPEAAPASDLSGLLPGDWFRVCMPLSRTPACHDLDALESWDVLTVVGYAVDGTLPAELSAEACLFETAFPRDCCYDVAVYDVHADPPADLCAGMLGNDDQTGGGGTDWSGGWLGRPFTVGEERRSAEIRAGTGWSSGRGALRCPPALAARVTRAWTEAGRAEHAAVASFARFTLELLALGAPSELVSRSLVAAADEVRHARVCFDVVRAVSGEAAELGPLPLGGALPERVDPAAVLVAAIREGCLEETVSALHVAEAAARCEDPELARALMEVAEDETRHAELSWAAVRWLLRTHPSLHPLARETFAALRIPEIPAPDAAVDALGRLGVLTDFDRAFLGQRVLEQVVRPCAAALLGEDSCSDWC